VYAPIFSRRLRKEFAAKRRELPYAHQEFHISLSRGFGSVEDNFCRLKNFMEEVLNILMILY
jgi:hypothetical protein